VTTAPSAPIRSVISNRRRRGMRIEHVAKPARRHQRGAGAALLEDRVGDDGGGVRQQAHVGRRDAVAFHRRTQRGEDAIGQVRRGGRHLGDADPAAGIVNQRHVGESSADINPDAPRHCRAKSPSSHDNNG